MYPQANGRSLGSFRGRRECADGADIELAKYGIPHPAKKRRWTVSVPLPAGEEDGALTRRCVVVVGGAIVVVVVSGAGVVVWYVLRRHRRSRNWCNDKSGGVESDLSTLGY